MEKKPQNGASEQPPTLQVQDMVTLTARLAQILAEEVDLLSEMKVSKIAELQKEKLFLISALEAQKKQIAKHPHLIDSLSARDKQDLKEVVGVFNDILEENHHKLNMAKKVNEKIVQAITSVVNESTRGASYKGNGTNGAAPFESLSVTLNETI